MLLEQLSVHAWIQNNQIKTESGAPLDFKIHRYLFDIYRDNSKYLCCIKAGQIGFSTMAILKTIWLSKNQRMDIGYILPTVEMVQKFVGSKVNRMAQQNPVIEKWMKDKNSITQKQIDNSYIHYLGAMTERSAIMLALDMLVADEYDKAPQEILEIYDSRLQHSKYGYKWVFSNPTIPDFGVDRFWSISDQKKWHIVHVCGKQYVMDESCINYTTAQYECPHCHGLITDEDRRMGEWIATNSVKAKFGDIDTLPTTETQWSGYWIPLWINPMISAQKIVDYKKNKPKEYFYNFVAGLPYVNPNDALSLPRLLKNLKDEVNAREGRTIIGLDTGHNLHYTLMNKQGIYFHGYCQSPQERNDPKYDPYDEIDALLENNKNWILVSDQGGDLVGVRKLLTKYPGRVFLCWFVKEKRTQQIIEWGENDKSSSVFVDRNRAVQLAVDQLNEGRMVFNGSQEDWMPFFNHALNIYRVREIMGQDENDPQYGWRWVWKRKGADHWFMSMIYALVGFDRFADDLAIVIVKDTFMKGVPTGSSLTGHIAAKRFIRGDIAEF